MWSTREFLRYDVRRARLCAHRRRVPSPLAAFRDGRNPYAVDHAGLERRCRAHFVPGGPHLLQVSSGENVSSRRPSWFRPRLPLDRLREFSLRRSPVTPAAPPLTGQRRPTGTRGRGEATGALPPRP